MWDFFTRFENELEIPSRPYLTTILELPKLFFGNVGLRAETRLLDIGDNRRQGGTDLVDVVVDGSTGKVQLPGDGAHRITILEDHQNDGGV